MKKGGEGWRWKERKDGDRRKGRMEYGREHRRDGRME